MRMPCYEVERRLDEASSISVLASKLRLGEELHLRSLQLAGFRPQQVTGELTIHDPPYHFPIESLKMPIKPIQGVGLAKSLPRMRSNLYLSKGIANLMQQMLRRNVVLDISVAFGKTELILCPLTPFKLTPPFILNNELGHRSRSVTDVVLKQDWERRLDTSTGTVCIQQARGDAFHMGINGMLRGRV